MAVEYLPRDPDIQALLLRLLDQAEKWQDLNRRMIELMASTPMLFSYTDAPENSPEADS